MRELVQLLRREHALDEARIYLTGFSYGGNGVFDLALARRSSNNQAKQ